MRQQVKRDERTIIRFSLNVSRRKNGFLDIHCDPSAPHTTVLQVSYSCGCLYIIELKCCRGRRYKFLVALSLVVYQWLRFRRDEVDATESPARPRKLATIMVTVCGLLVPCVLLVEQHTTRCFRSKAGFPEWATNENCESIEVVGLSVWKHAICRGTRHESTLPLAVCPTIKGATTRFVR